MSNLDLSLLSKLTTMFVGRGGERIPVFAELSLPVQRRVLDATPSGKGLDHGALVVLNQATA